MTTNLLSNYIHNIPKQPVIQNNNNGTKHDVQIINVKKKNLTLI